MTKKAPSKTEAKTDTKSKKNKEALTLPEISEADISVLNRLYDVVQSRKGTDPSVSHSARLLSRGTYKIAQKFGEEAVECLIEAVAGRKDLMIGESADVLYHLIVLWVDAGITPDQVWAELQRREGTSGIAEKAARSKTTKSVKE
ncbi:phosphoribosyl-ATP diphosphatase [Acetobacter pasteurianus]|uniref:Phosphoribosyl-ATP pyrophosphatase n=4 Tax=Acetobacter pasteurianus TaxID=438 RepID=C7JH16_ACEP3|nr:phosphoribosyl-ATP diphosphatase [Acetobacter pasteurianus]ASC05670.1 Phosphoribosyl-ATP diphosphatase [Acetobacter pasteurianus subsp. pasteurianus]OAZ61260.1 Phosphoribosyl-ATP diphosphatase [Acetobacter pasteurianus]RCL07961.1 phosphoribosyl-ATP diphosphatase [Acetobacter pasteurianus]BAI00751.1 phosphoribosyl ATP pyrophosphatase [Acetobacter pasteurianus IFO 3283-01]BAI03800.1 phosphoribosyl ATP pyrophosphatase [Acetobacter pasteurianus IFO 3283-03]